MRAEARGESAASGRGSGVGSRRGDGRRRRLRAGQAGQQLRPGRVRDEEDGREEQGDPDGPGCLEVTHPGNTARRRPRGQGGAARLDGARVPPEDGVPFRQGGQPCDVRPSPLSWAAFFFFPRPGPRTSPRRRP